MKIRINCWPQCNKNMGKLKLGANVKLGANEKLEANGKLEANKIKRKWKQMRSKCASGTLREN